jgi:hypothetical protein
MTSFIPPVLGGGGLGGVQLALSAVFESRNHTISRLSVPRAQFAGDTATTLTDGSFNTRIAGTNAAIPKSASAFLANTTNTFKTATTPASLGKPLIIKVQRDELTSEIKRYGVFNADGTYPGAASTTPFDPLFDPYQIAAGSNPRYRVNTATGEIYLNNSSGLRNLNNPDGTIFATAANVGTDGVVGIVEFEALQGGAMSIAQQQASELSGVIQSLTSILRAITDSKKGTLSIIR